MNRGNEETDHYAYLKLLILLCCYICMQCLCHSLYILMRRLL